MDEKIKFEEFFLERSTVRRYSATRQVSDELLKGLLEAASHAPTTGNMQLYSVVATRSPEGKKALAPLHFNQPQIEGCSVVLTFCADLNRFEEWCRQRDAKPGFENLHSFITALIDASLFAQQFVTLAELNGLGTCYLGTVTYNATGIAEILGLPERVIPVLCVTVGYPAEDSVSAPADRIPVEGILHHEKYNPYTPDKINAIYGPKEALPESAQFIAENGKQTLAQVFTDIRYPADMNAAVTDTFATLLRQNRFL